MCNDKEIIASWNAVLSIWAHCM